MRYFIYMHKICVHFYNLMVKLIKIIQRFNLLNENYFNP